MKSWISENKLLPGACWTIGATGTGGGVGSGGGWGPWTRILLASMAATYSSWAYIPRKGESISNFPSWNLETSIKDKITGDFSSYFGFCPYFFKFR